MRQLVSISGGFRVPKVAAFRLGLSICVLAYALPSRDCDMKLENQRLDLGMAALQGWCAFFFNN